MARWLAKTEPGDYAWDDLVRDGGTRWDGVKNPGALIHLRKIKAGDEVLVYHTGREKQIVGIARATSDAYADPAGDDERWAVVDLEAVRPLPQPVTLKDLKADPSLADFDLIRQGRLSVMAVPAPVWKKLMKRAGA